MNILDTQYKVLLQNIYDNGIDSDNRTGISSKTLPSATITHDMSKGFPLLTIKKVPFKTMAVELEGFVKGITSKKWFQERGCHIWDEWCNPQKVPYGHSEKAKKEMMEEDDLGFIYGSQWRDFHDPAAKEFDYAGDLYETGNNIDQLKGIVETLQKNPQDRRMICSAWNPLALDCMALPPCHVLFQVSVLGKKLNLSWFQRSVDVPLGLPFNIASYGLLLHLLAKIYGFEEGILTGFLNNVHFYNNQMEGVQEILGRTTHYSLPSIETKQCGSLFDWEHSLSSLKDYSCLPTVKMPIAV